jgi:hypothetical protein
MAPEVSYAALDKRLNGGSLPAIFDSPHPGEDLRAYVGVYLQEEIRAEGFANVLMKRGEILPGSEFVWIGARASDFSRTAGISGLPAF